MKTIGVSKVYKNDYQMLPKFVVLIRFSLFDNLYLIVVLREILFCFSICLQFCSSFPLV